MPRAGAEMRASLEPLPGPGQWVWTCREGFERDLIEELTLARKDQAPRVLAPALIATRGEPPRREGVIDVTFARQALAVQASVRASSSAEMVARVTEALHAAIAAAGPEHPWALHAWVPDSARANPLSASVETLQRAVEMRSAALDAAWADRRMPSARAALDAGGLLAQVCVPERGIAIVGVTPASEVPSLYPGGRARMRAPAAAPSRAAMKLEEALDWIGHGPAPGERCVDLGAAPGGWTLVLLERGAHVTAVDPADMAEALTGKRRLMHVRGSAFDFEPTEAIDWLFCDMVWRPLEVASLLARWGRRRWARFLVANIKLPMRGKSEFLGRVRALLRAGGWEGLRMRHLYHDREEVTLTAHLPR